MKTCAMRIVFDDFVEIRLRQADVITLLQRNLKIAVAFDFENFDRYEEKHPLI